MKRNPHPHPRLYPHLYPGVCYVLGMLIAITAAQSDDVIRKVLTENNEVDAVVANVVQDAGLSDRYTDEELSQLTFQLLRRDSPGSEAFSLDSTSGVLTASRSIDRDVICARMEECVVRLQVSVEPGDFFQLIQFEITVEDINDNSPTFPAAQIVRFLSEASLPGHAKVPLVTAVDDDSPQFGIVRYQLIPENEFRLQRTPGVNGRDDLQLLLHTLLDREDQDTYNLEVVAFDGAGRTGTLQVEVQVQDFNDNFPVFDDQAYSLIIPEDTAVDTPLIQVHASDADSGSNGEVSYSFGPGTPSEYLSLFSIDSSTGVVTLTSELDYEVRQEYSLELSAKDGHPDSIATIAVLDIQLQDQNDHRPEIILNSATPEGHLEVDEEQEVPEFVGHITVLDQDTGSSGVFSCVLSSGPFTLEPYPNIDTEFKVMSTAVFDREQRDQYTVTLTCTDEGQPPLVSSQEIVIDIADTNDHDPEFGRTLYTASLEENNSPGDEVIMITASDLDIGMNGALRYSISTSPTGAVFDVDSHTGQVSVHSRLDYEEFTSIQLTLTARDLGDTSRSSTTLLIVSVIDVDDAVPEFYQESYTFYVPEEQPSGYIVGNVTAHDPDTISRSTTRPSFMYSLDPRHNPGSLFSIRPYTGELYTARVLDREVQASYELRVLAMNTNTSNTQIGSAGISIIITDVNDNAPVLEFPSLANNTLHIATDLAIGQVFGRIQSHDRDENSRLTYRLISGNDQGYFVVAQYSGEVSLAHDLSSLHEEQTFRMVVAVRDGSHQTAATLNVLLTIAEGQGSRSNSSDGDRNLLIVIVIACVTAVIVVLLLVAIVVVLKRRHGNNKYNYKARLVDQAKARDLHAPIGLRDTDDVTSPSANHSLDSIQIDQKDSAMIQQQPMASLSHCLYNMEGGATYPNYGNHGYGKHKVAKDDDADSAISRDNSDSGRGSNEDVESPNGKGPHRMAADRASGPSSEHNTSRNGPYGTTQNPYGTHAQNPYATHAQNPYGTHAQVPPRPPSRQHAPSRNVSYRQPPHVQGVHSNPGAHNNPGAHGHVSTRGLEPGVHGEYASNYDITAPPRSRPVSRGLWPEEGRRDSQRSGTPQQSNSELNWHNDNYTASNA